MVTLPSQSAAVDLPQQNDSPDPICTSAVKNAPPDPVRPGHCNFQTDQLLVCYGGRNRDCTLSKQRLSHWIILHAYRNSGQLLPAPFRCHSTWGVSTIWAALSESLHPHEEMKGLLSSIYSLQESTQGSQVPLFIFILDMHLGNGVIQCLWCWWSSGTHRTAVTVVTRRFMYIGAIFFLWHYMFTY